MLNIQRQFFPLIDTNDFKKILNNLHKKTRRSDISLTGFKNEIVKLLGYDNFSHFNKAVSNAKSQYSSHIKGYGFDYSNGSYLLYPIENQIRKLLGIPRDLYTDFLDEQAIRFCKKKPFLVINGTVYHQDTFNVILQTVDNNPSTRILICMAYDENDAMACYRNLLIEEPINHPASFYEDVDEVRYWQLSHLQPSCASPFWVDNIDDLPQFKRPDVALKCWAVKNKDEGLISLLDVAISDNRFRCRIYIDEFSSNFKINNNQLIKAHRLFTVEVITSDGLSLDSVEGTAKHYFDEDITSDDLATAESIVKYVKSLKNRLIKKYGKVSVFILSNGVSFLESSDRELVIPFSEVLGSSFSSNEHRNGILKAFGVKNLTKFIAN